MAKFFPLPGDFGTFTLENVLTGRTRKSALELNYSRALGERHKA